MVLTGEEVAGVVGFGKGVSGGGRIVEEADLEELDDTAATGTCFDIAAATVEVTVAGMLVDVPVDSGRPYRK